MWPILYVYISNFSKTLNRWQIQILVKILFIGEWKYKEQEIKWVWPILYVYISNFSKTLNRWKIQILVKILFIGEWKYNKFVWDHSERSILKENNILQGRSLWGAGGGAVTPLNFPNFVKFLGKMAARRKLCIVNEILAPHRSRGRVQHAWGQGLFSCLQVTGLRFYFQLMSMKHQLIC